MLREHLVMTVEKRAATLKPGDVFDYEHQGRSQEVTVLGRGLPHTDVTGKSVLKFWCASGPGEGWMVFGHQAVIHTKTT